MTDVGEKKIEPVRNCCYSCKLLARFVARPPNFFQKWSRLTRLFAMTVTKTWRYCTSPGILVGRTVENAPVK